MQFAIIDEPGTVVSIDVFETAARDLPRLVEVAREMLAIGGEDPEFIDGASHVSIPALQQPLVWLGRVPLRRRFVAIYCRWRDGHRRTFSASQEGRRLLASSRALSPTFELLLRAPGETLYFPTLLDATGELCPGQSDCEAGRGVGPIIDDGNPRAQFINVFETTPDRQQALLDGTFAIMPIARRHEGYLRTALHRGIDGTKVANYGQYRDVGQVRGMYFHARTAMAFGRLMLEDVTRPYTIFGRTVTIGGRRLGTAPELRCYDVDRVVRQIA